MVGMPNSIRKKTVLDSYAALTPEQARIFNRIAGDFLFGLSRLIKEFWPEAEPMLNSPKKGQRRKHNANR
jgi:hypothetical protein